MSENVTEERDYKKEKRERWRSRIKSSSDKTENASEEKNKVPWYQWEMSEGEWEYLWQELRDSGRWDDLKIEKMRRLLDVRYSIMSASDDFVLMKNRPKNLPNYEFGSLDFLLEQIEAELKEEKVNFSESEIMGNVLMDWYPSYLLWRKNWVFRSRWKAIWKMTLYLLAAYGLFNLVKSLKF